LTARWLLARFVSRLTPMQKRRLAQFVRASRRDPAHVLSLSPRERGKLLTAVRRGIGL